MGAPSIVLITIECWRGDHFGPLTPSLTQLASEAVTFPDTQVLAGWTLPSMTALMSSAFASMHGGPVIGLKSPLRRTLAECLLDAGFWTCGLTANAVCSGMNAFHRGFGTFALVTRPIRPQYALAARLTANWRELAAAGISAPDVEDFADATRVTDAAIAWLKDRPDDQPYFLWLHYLDPHWPFLTSASAETPIEIEEEWQERRFFRNRFRESRGRCDVGPLGDRWKSRYRSAVERVDSEAGRLLDVLRERADWDRTIVAVTGDHGEEFNEHGSWLHQWNQLHKEGVHVPLVLRLPGADAGEIRTAVSHLDLAPTLLDYAGVAAPGSMMGKSLRETIAGAGDFQRPMYCEMLSHPGGTPFAVAIREGRWKYIHDSLTPLQPQLFDQEADPFEMRNVIGEQPQLRRRFEEMRLRHYARGVIDLMSREQRVSQAPDDTAREQLRALGYI